MLSSKKLFISALLLGFASATFGDLQVTVSGNMIIASGTAPAPSSGYAGSCCWGSNIDSSNIGPGCTPDCRAPYYGRDTYTCLWVGTHTVYAMWTDGRGGYEYDQRSVEITEPPSYACETFQWTVPGMVLTHKYRFADSYPPYQTGDGRAELRLRSKTVAPGTTVYLKVIDPPTTSPYGSSHTADDNKDPLGGSFSLGGEKTKSVVVPTSGYMTVPFYSTFYAAGDNYHVLASADPALHSDPAFVCAAGCAKSARITAWKRVYLEADRMFRSGAYMRAGKKDTNTVTVTDISPFAAKQRIILITSPFPGEPGATALEPFTIKNVDKKTRTLTLDGKLARDYSGPVTIAGSTWNSLADAVGVVSSVGEFVPNTDLVRTLFVDAFVDVVTLDDDPAPYVPYEAVVDGDAAANSEMKFLAQKWSFHENDPNHLHVIGASQDPSMQHFGVSQSWFGYNFAMLFVKAFEQLASANPLGANAETTVHELTHLWRVNFTKSPAYGGHCANLKRYVGDGKFCTMHSPFQDSTCAAPGVFCPEFHDGQVMFHYVDDDDSEYMTIRTAGDPLSEVGPPPGQ